MTSRRESAHPSDEALAAFLDRTLPAAEREVVGAHLDLCEACRAELGLAAGILVDVDAHRRRKRLLAPIGAAVAAVVAALLLLPPEPPSVQRSGPAEGTPTFEVVAPVDGQALASAPAMFVWRGMGASASYVLTLTNDLGDVVWSTRTADTMAVLPESIVLRPGQYYWLVDALLERGREATSGIRRFQVAN